MENNQLQVFTNEELKLKVKTITNEDGSIGVNAEDIVFAFGWTQTKNGKIYPKYERLNGHLKGFGFPHDMGKDDYIPESAMYLLGMKAENEVAKKFQQWLAVEVIPTIRKHGAYMTTEVIEKTLSDPDFIIKLATQLKEEKIKNKQLSVENEALASDILKWADTSIINALVRKYGASLGENWGIAWTNFKKELLYKYSINLNSRITAYLNTSGKKTKPKTLDMLNGKEELTNALKTALAMCKERKIDTYDILGKHIGDIDIE